ncbi:MAG: type I methionyl aminopeptidase [Candidatus Tectomicrobia bacterium]|uniref:Methionine aminopeptidase n=1 Tax=Tectimicrobiota bacterium TaxID=2528274 RepID=A0A932LZC8_UNCTE|nr:type I methionyl aminopeptidase [Candidatus Tectomicrobia bacterium]
MIILKSPQEIEKIRASCRIVAEALQLLEKAVEPGITTLELNDIAERYLKERGAAPAFKGYRGFPMSLCASINEEVVHGIPSAQRKLREGDVISLDLGSLYEGYYGDAAITVGVGEIPEVARKLLEVTRASLECGLQQVRENNCLSDISHAIQTAVEKEGFSVVRIFVGHGIGASLHEEPQIPNFGPPGRGPRLKEGMVLAVEPMVNVGTSDVRILDDKWTVVTQDGSLSAHFEHTVAVAKNGCDVLSRFN